MQTAESIQLTSHLTCLSGVGPKLFETLSRAHLATLSDLLFHLPYRYQDRTRITAIPDLTDSDWAVVQGTIIRQDVVFRRKRQMICHLQDAQGLLKIRFFYFNRSLQDNLKEGTTVRIFGQARLIKSGMEMAHPEINIIEEDKPFVVEDTLTPIYHSVQGLSQAKLRLLINQTLELLKGKVHDILLKDELCELGQYALLDSLKIIHFPPPDCQKSLLEEKQHPLQLRLALEELTAQQLVMTNLKQKREKQKSIAFVQAVSLKKKLLSNLPFELTNAQLRVIRDIETDLTKSYPMYRLVQGDVGSGKTLVAAISLLGVVEKGYQVALMAPTEILAKQHALNFATWLNPLGIETTLLTGKQGIKERRELLAHIENGQAQVVLGTHAIFQDKVSFHRLALVIIDEQHRFGVKQRLALKNKGADSAIIPHELVMTATPIPRSLAQTKYAFLDVSTIDELPKGRKPITTVVMASNKRASIIDKLDKAIRSGQQAYWVCTLIEESENLQCENALKTFEEIQQELPNHRIGLIHGRLSGAEKDTTMQSFKNHDIDLLVATTVIEVGVDVPNATIMIIDNAERFGLSQLHQLRGRIGRGDKESFCVLLYQTPLSADGKERLMTMRDNHCGFKISEADLKLRGSGEFLGTRQTGFQSLRIANLQTHHHLLARSQQLASNISQDKARTEALIKRWIGTKASYWQS